MTIAILRPCFSVTTLWAMPMILTTARTLVLEAGVIWCAVGLIKSAVRGERGLRWYDRFIRFAGALLMGALAVGGIFLTTGKWHAR